jgi:predicted transposase YdaD
MSELVFRELKLGLSQYEESKRMPYITSIERRGIEKGREEGRQEG